MTTEQHSTATRGGTQSGLGVGGFVTGLAGLVLSWLIPIVGLVLGVLGVVLGSVGRRQAARNRTPAGLATAGIVLGALAVVASVVFWVIAYNALT